MHLQGDKDDRRHRASLSVGLQGVEGPTKKRFDASSLLCEMRRARSHTGWEDEEKGTKDGWPRGVRRVKGVDALRLFSEPITATMLKSLGAEV